MQPLTSWSSICGDAMGCQGMKEQHRTRWEEEEADCAPSSSRCPPPDDIPDHTDISDESEYESADEVLAGPLDSPRLTQLMCRSSMITWTTRAGVFSRLRRIEPRTACGLVSPRKIVFRPQTSTSGSVSSTDSHSWHTHSWTVTRAHEKISQH